MKIYSIYRITNLVNSKVYIGYTHNPSQRWSRHKALHQTMKKSWLYAAMRDHGVHQFSFEVIYQSKDKDHTKNVMEGYFINEYRSFVKFPDSNGYNSTLGGDGGPGVTSEVASALNKQRVATGTHVFLSDAAKQISSQVARARNQRMLADGSHPFKDTERNKERQRNRVESGEHPFLHDGKEKSERNKRLASRSIVATLNALCKQHGISAKNNHMRPDDWIVNRITQLSVTAPSASQAT